MDYFEWHSLEPRYDLSMNYLSAAYFSFIFFFCIYIFRRQKATRQNEPPVVPYLIPFLGHALAFSKDNYGFFDSIKKKFPDEKILTIKLAGQTMHVIFDGELALPVYRSHRIFAFDALATLIFRAFGCSKADLMVPNRGANPPENREHGETKENNGFLVKLHDLSIRCFRNEGLDTMTEIYIQQLQKRIEDILPPVSSISEEWKEMELVSFVTRLFTLSAIASLFGTKILEREGDDKILNWVWGLDPHVNELVSLLPDFMFREAAKRREEGLDIMTRWERQGRASDRIGENTKAAWDENWGVSSCRERVNLAEEEGLTERSRAAVQIALIWGQNANSIPVATWLAISALSNPESLPALLSEVNSCIDINGTIDITQLTKQSGLRAVLHETYRLKIHSAGVRTVVTDTHLGSYFLEKGSLVMVHGRTLQLSSSIWGPKALSFDPQRFRKSQDAPSKAAKDESRKRQQNLRPFGGGYNLCPGRHFAENEILGGFAVLMTMLEIEIIDGQGEVEVELRKGKLGGLWPDREVMVRMRRRR